MQEGRRRFDGKDIRVWASRNLDAVLNHLIAEGVTVDSKREDYGEFGRFGWITDPAGNRVELWQPAKND